MKFSKDKSEKTHRSHDEKNNDDAVITPGGPRPRHIVRRVGPDEAVRLNEKGTYSIISKKRFNKEKH